MKTIITITQKIPSACRRAINHAAYDGSYSDTSLAWNHIGRNKYGALGEDPHATARRMMVVAGTTFKYELRG